MLSSLQIQNFRGLKDVKINSLGRVNLIVGENNAGKSSVLEALRIYASGGNPYELNDILKSHQEGSIFEEDIYFYTDNDYENKIFASLFFQREYPNKKNQNIFIGDDGNFILEISYNEEREISGLEVYYNSRLNHKIPRMICNDRSVSSPTGKDYFVIFFKYIPTQIETHSNLAYYWDKIILTPYENEVIKSLQIIEPDIEKLAFINNPIHPDDRIPIVALKNSEKPIPLYSMGDGMRRILQLILNLHQAKDGLLLIDEFDNGLHYKVQEKVWGLLFELAERFNVQVFATTHSNDCIRAFSKISQERTDIDGMLIQMTKEQYKDGTSQIVANVVDENQLQRLLNLGVDVR